jgi:hypothetical protein
MFNRPGEVEQSRVQLVNVPYPMRAVDAVTLGGRPASAYLLDPNATGSANAGTTTQATSSPSLKPRETFGTLNYIPYFTDNSGDFGNSMLYQSGSDVGVGTASPLYALHVYSTSKTAAAIEAQGTSNPLVEFRRTDSGGAVSQTGDNLGEFVAVGKTTSDYSAGAGGALYPGRCRYLCPRQHRLHHAELQRCLGRPDDRYQQRQCGHWHVEPGGETGCRGEHQLQWPYQLPGESRTAIFIHLQ